MCSQRCISGFRKIPEEERPICCFTCALCPERHISNHTGIKIYNHLWSPYQGFPGGSAGKKKSTCNPGDPSSIPGLGRSSGEGVGYPLRYSWASLVAQKVKNLPAMQDTWVHPWVGKITQRRAWPPTPVFLPGEPHGQRSVAGHVQSIGLQGVGHD